MSAESIYSSQACAGDILRPQRWLLCCHGCTPLAIAACGLKLSKSWRCLRCYQTANVALIMLAIFRRQVNREMGMKRQRILTRFMTNLQRMVRRKTASEGIQSCSPSAGLSIAQRVAVLRHPAVPGDCCCNIADAPAGTSLRRRCALDAA
jgi:hypothetical protein